MLQPITNWKLILGGAEYFMQDTDNNKVGSTANQQQY